MLVRTDGAVRARWPLAGDGTKQLPVTAPSLVHIKKGETSGVISAQVSKTGERRIVAYRRLDGLPVYIAIGMREAALLAGWVRTMEIVAAIMLPITLMLVAVSAVARRRAQLEQLAQLAVQEQNNRQATLEKSALEAHRRETLASLTGGVAHDFNNLLAILSNSLSVQDVRHPELANEPQHAAMRRAIKSGTRLTRQLLSFTRKQALKPEVVALQSWLPELEELLRTTLGPLVRLTVVVEASTAPISVDAAELELALINLAVNAKHAQPTGGAFTVHARNVAEEDGQPGEVVIRANDEGHGIPKEILPRVTEPFFTTKERGSGSGLGLNQVQGVVEASGGRLRISSEVGQGTRVELIFPACDRRTDVRSPRSEEGDKPVKFEGHVLVAEDNDDVAAVTTALITSMGLRVTRATNAIEALQILQTPVLGAKIGYLLTDVIMPGAIDGVQLAMQLRKERPELPVTVITGYTENVQSAVRAELDVVQKPLALADLLVRLHNAFPLFESGA